MSDQGSEGIQVRQSGELTTVQYWDTKYAADAADASESDVSAGSPAPRRRPLARVRAWLRPHVRPYDEAVLWERLYPEYLSSAAGLKAVEIGSAPGTFLVQLARRFGVEPYGIEYAAQGVAVNRRVFEENGVPADRVLHEDFLSERLHARYREYFDVVVSRGFVEHFDDPRAVIDRHLNLLKPGGTLIVQIPNLRGLNYIIQRVLDRQILELHNLAIMDRRVFRALFDATRLEERFCGYYGGFTFNPFNARRQRWPILRACFRAQLAINAFLHLSLRGRTAGHGWISPALLYVGVKRA